MLIDPLERRCHLSASIFPAARTISGALFRSATALPAFANSIRSGVAGDFNGDGRLDLAVVSGSGQGDSFSGDATVLLNRGDGSFNKANSLVISGEPGVLQVGNFNFDRQLDLVISTSNGADVLIGNGNGTFASPISLLAHDAGAADGDNLAVGDFNGDGRLDVATSGFTFAGSGAGTTIESQIAVFLGIGNGAFIGPRFTRIAGDHGLSLEAIRINRDSSMDLAVGADNQLKLLAAKGDGTFDFPAVVAADNPTFVQGVDVNSDGRTDLLWRDGDQSFYALARRRFRGFAAPQQVAPDSPAVAVGDYNRDRFNDLLLSPTANASRILLGRAGGSFRFVGDPVRVDAGLPPIVGDFNSDGRDDVVTADLRAIHFANSPRSFLDGAGNLIVTGTRRSDTIDITRDGSEIRVAVNGGVFGVSFFDVNQIRIAAGRGNDVITVAAGLTKNVFAAAGAGNDRIVTGAGQDTLIGGGGSDLLVGGLGDDSLQGDAGNDDLDGSLGNDTIFGGADRDVFHVTDNGTELKDRQQNESVIF